MSIWNDLADIEFKLHFVDADGVKTRVLESGTGEPLCFYMVQGAH